MFDKKVTRNSPVGEELQATLPLIKQYEDIHFPIPYPAYSMRLATIYILFPTMVVLAIAACRKEKTEAPLQPKTAADYIRQLVGDHQMRGTVYDGWSNLNKDTTYEVFENWHVSLVNDTCFLVKMDSGGDAKFTLGTHDSVNHNYRFYSDNYYYTTEYVDYYYEKDSIEYSYKHTHYAVPASFAKKLHSYN